MRTLIRPTGFVDSPFGHDGKVARLAGGLNWFAAVELIAGRGPQRVPRPNWCRSKASKSRFDDDMAAQWQALTAPRAAAAARRAHDPPRPAAGDGHRQRDARQLLRRRPVRRRRGGGRGRRATWRREGAAIIDVGGESTRPGAKLGLGRRRDRAHRAGHPPARGRRRGGLGRHAQG